MKQAEHRRIHEELHRSLDLLLADFLAHNPDRLPSNTRVLELMKWSYEQTIEPTELEACDGRRLRLIREGRT